jgi:redox-sensitive bicupin YhaK (pirin superfamily)
MPAVTADPITLPRVTPPLPAASARPVVSVTTAPRGFEGEGFPVRRAFAGVDLRALDPFIHMDQMGEVEYAPGEPKGTPWHPHRGFETVTYMLDGQMAHSDSHGGGGLIGDGDTQWMTAGAGILHIETPPEHVVLAGGLFHGVQLWVNLPKALKLAPPRYQDITARKVALLSSSDGGALLRVIAGDLDGHAGPGSTHTPITLVHATLAAGASVTLPWRPDFNALAYALSGRGYVGPKERPFASGQLAVFGTGDSLTLEAAPGSDLDVFLLGGQPIREPVVAYGPFVMNTRAEIVQAFEDYQKGRLGSIHAAHAGVDASTPDS